MLGKTFRLQPRREFIILGRRRVGPPCISDVGGLIRREPSNPRLPRLICVAYHAHSPNLIWPLHQLEA